MEPTPIDLIVIDGPNLYNAVATELSKFDLDEQLLKRYLEDCLNFDHLALLTLNAHLRRNATPTMGIVIFHSRKPLGRGAYYLSDKKTDAFWARQSSLPNTSTFLVDLPGEQQDTYVFECAHCKKSNETVTRSEKGIDTSIATYMMETADSWRSACLFSRDVDYAPLVAALRRKGKIVYVAVPPEEKATALVRVAQSAAPLSREYLAVGVAAVQFLMAGGILDQLVGLVTTRGDARFAVDVNSVEHTVSLGITHAKGLGSTLQQELEPVVRKLVVPAVEIEQRNDEFLIVKLPRGDAVDRIIATFGESATWAQHLGDMHELHRKLTSPEGVVV